MPPRRLRLQPTLRFNAAASIKAPGTVTGSNIMAGGNAISASTTSTAALQIETIAPSSNTTFSLAEATAGQEICLLFIQDATGGRT
jgi:hypothetical protein